MRQLRSGKSAAFRVNLRYSGESRKCNPPGSRRYVVRLCEPRRPSDSLRGNTCIECRRAVSIWPAIFPQNGRHYLGASVD